MSTHPEFETYSKNKLSSDIMQQNMELEGEFILEEDQKESKEKDHALKVDKEPIPDTASREKETLEESKGHINETRISDKNPEDEITEKIPEEDRVRDVPPRVKKSPHFFTSLCHYPKDVEYINQERDEEIILLIRRDFITNVPWLLGIGLLALLPVGIAPFYSFLFPFLNLSMYTLVLILLFYYLCLFGFLILQFSLWYFHVSIVTTLRIVDIDVFSLLLRSVSETRLTNVEEVSFNQHGFIRSLFNYGDVMIQTAGSMQNVEFDKAPDPHFIATIIGDHIGRKRT